MGSRELLPRRRCTSGTPAAAAGGPLSPPAPPWSGRDSPHPGETPRVWSKEVKKQELWQSPCFTLGLEETSLFPAFKTIWVCVACAYNLRGVLQIRWVTSVLGLPDEGFGRHHGARTPHFSPWPHDWVLPSRPPLSVGLPSVVPSVTHLLEDHKLVLRSRALVDLIFISARRRGEGWDAEPRGSRPHHPSGQCRTRGA